MNACTNINLWRILCLPMILSGILFSCKIDDDHGSPYYENNKDDFESIEGDLISEFTSAYRFIFSEQDKKIFFFKDGSYNKCSVMSLDIETSQTTNLYTSPQNEDIDFIDIVTENGLLYFFEYGFPESKLYSCDILSSTIELILSGEYLSPGSICVNSEFIFYNYEIDQYYIKKLDSNGAEEILPARGWPVQCLKNNSKIIIYNSKGGYYGSYEIFDYSLNETVFHKDANEIHSRFYEKDNQLYVLIGYPTPVIKDFYTDVTLFSFPSQYGYLIEYNVKQNLAVFHSEKTIFNAFKFPIIYLSKLDVLNLETDSYQNIVSIYHDNESDRNIIDLKICDNGKSIIYSSNKGFYRVNF